jgi:hypothetical protein
MDEDEQGPQNVQSSSGDTLIKYTIANLVTDKANQSAAMAC